MRQKGYVSPTDKSNGNGLEQWDRAYYRRVARSSEELRRAIVRYQNRSATFNAAL